MICRRCIFSIDMSILRNHMSIWVIYEIELHLWSFFQETFGSKSTYVIIKLYQTLYDMDFELKFEADVNVLLLTAGLFKFWIDT